MPDATLDVIDFAEYGAEGFAYQLDRTPWNWVPVVVQLHGPLAMFAKRVGWPDQDSEFYRVGMFMEGLSIRQADAVMACSANIADFTADLYTLPRGSIDVVHCGVDSESFRPVDPKQQQNDSRPIVLFVGNIAANKGVTTVFEAALRLRSKYPEIKLQILGKGDDDLTKRLKSRAERSGAAANVEFAGFVNRDRLPQYYQRASVFCSPAQHEVGVANVYIEAMACGCPVVGSTTGAAPEAVTDFETGLLVPPNDVEATAAALDRILCDRSFRQRLGAAGRRQVEDYFAMDKYTGRILAIYRKAITNARHKLERASSVSK
jgi:glycosyltransferase involved in cell wall biosynthesis